MSTATAATPSTPPEALVAPPGLAGVIVATTALSDVRGQQGFYHYRQYDAVDLARSCSIEEVWHLLLRGHLPDEAELAAFRATIADAQRLPGDVTEALAGVAGATPDGTSPMPALRTALSMLGGALDLTPVWDLSPEERERDAIRVAAQVSVLAAAVYQRSQGLDPLDPRPDLGYTANHLWMIIGAEPAPEHVRAVERYLCLTVDHGFNASTFTARVVASTGADVAACVVAALGALSGPLHGGAPSRALDTLDAIGSADRIDPWVRAAVESGDRIMGFGHPIYRTEDPRSRMLKGVARGLAAGRPEAERLVGFAEEVEHGVLSVLAELKPGRELHTNVEFYAGVVMELCGLPRAMFTPTFAVARVIGWSANVLEQALDSKIIRPSSRYVGPPPPQPVPPA